LGGALGTFFRAGPASSRARTLETGWMNSALRLNSALCAALLAVPFAVAAPSASAGVRITPPPGADKLAQAPAQLQLGDNTWQIGEQITSERRWQSDLETSWTRDGKLVQRFTHSRETLALIDTRVDAVEKGRLRGATVHFRTLLERAFEPEENSEMPLRETHATLESQIVEIALTPEGPRVKSAGGGTVAPSLARAVLAQTLSSARDLDTGARALETWLAGKSFVAGASFAVPTAVALDLLQPEEGYDQAALALTFVTLEGEHALFTASARLLNKPAEGSQETEAQLTGTLRVETRTARVVALDLTGTVAVAGAALGGDVLTEISGRGHLEFHQHNSVSRATAAR
jgi:hypothetical protein